MADSDRGTGRGFAHLHARSGFSYGYGTATPEELVEAAATAGYRALALTDRDGLYGIPRFLKAAGQTGISPIVGTEVSMEEGGHVVLLAEDMEGYRSLSRLVTAYRTSSADRRRPACPLPTLLDYASSLVCLTGAVPFGLLPRLVLSKDTGLRGKSRELMGLLREAFGPGNLYAELTDDRTAGSRRRVRAFEAFAREHRIPTLAAHEVAYLSPADHRLHEVLAAATNLSALPPPDYRLTDWLHLAPSTEMGRLFADRPEALRNAAAVAERCAGAVRLDGGLHLPSAILSGGDQDQGKELLRLVLAGAREKYRATKEVEPSRIKARLRREIACIVSMGFAGYFLVAHEALAIAKEKGIPVTGRGSAANSLVAYCLGLTQPEPFSNRLLFERFLNESRRDPPDIDLDLCSRRRDEVRDELIARYRGRGAAVAATAGTLSLRGAVRVAARALGHPPAEIDALSRHVPRRAGSWEEALEEPAMRGHPLRGYREGHRLLLELSEGLAGRLWQPGTHLGGVVFGTEESHLSELVPLEPTGKPGLLRCQYDKDDLEYVGLPKLDLLGLRMHTAFQEAGELVSKRLGEEVDPLSPPPNDKETYSLIRSGKTAGMFQLESPGQTNLSGRLKPRRFSDLVAQISLFRPGPVRGELVTPYVERRNGREPYSVPLPELDEVLRPTYGILLYQEQVLEIASRVAGFTLAEGDLLRRAMTKDRGSGAGAMRELRREFLGRAAARDVPPDKAAEVFSWIEGFSVYGFSAAHAASFAEISYASAYMKRHYPAEFFCGLLNSQPMGFYSPRTLVNEARREGICVLAPDLHLSGEGFTVEEDGRAIRVGLKYARGLSRRAMGSILEQRTRRPFASARDLYSRTAVERDQLESLVKGGFLDALSSDPGGRGALLSEVRALARKPVPVRRRAQEEEELPLTPAGGSHPANWWERREESAGGWRVSLLPTTAEGRERMEWEALSLNVSHHPLSRYREALLSLGTVPSAEVPGLPHGRRARVAGLLEALQCPPTKSSKRVYFLLIEDEAGLLQATIFQKVYEKYGEVLHRSGAFLLDGRVERDRRRGHSYLVERIRDLGEVLGTTGERRVPSRGRSHRPMRRQGPPAAGGGPVSGRACFEESAARLMNVAHSNASPNGGRASGDGSSGFRQRRAPYLPDGYRLLASEGDGLLLRREDSSEVGSFEPHELEQAEQAAFEDARERRHHRRNHPLL